MSVGLCKLLVIKQEESIAGFEGIILFDLQAGLGSQASLSQRLGLSQGYG